MSKVAASSRVGDMNVGKYGSIALNPSAQDLCILADMTYSDFLIYLTSLMGQQASPRKAVGLDLVTFEPAQ